MSSVRKEKETKAQKKTGAGEELTRRWIEHEGEGSYWRWLGGNLTTACGSSLKNPSLYIHCNTNLSKLFLCHQNPKLVQKPKITFHQSLVQDGRRESNVAACLDNDELKNLT